MVFYFFLGGEYGIGFGELRRGKIFVSFSFLKKLRIGCLLSEDSRWGKERVGSFFSIVGVVYFREVVLSDEELWLGVRF